MSPNFWGCRCCGGPEIIDGCNLRFYPLDGSTPDPLAAWYLSLPGSPSGLIHFDAGSTWVWTFTTLGIVQIEYPTYENEWGDVLHLDPHKPEYEPPAGAVGTSKGPKELIVGPIGPISDSGNSGAYVKSAPVIQLEAVDQFGVTRDLNFGPNTFGADAGIYLYDQGETPLHVNGFTFNPLLPHPSTVAEGYNMSAFGEPEGIVATQFAMDAIVGKVDIQFLPTSRFGSEFIEYPTDGFWRMNLTQWIGDVPCGIKGSGNNSLPSTVVVVSEWESGFEATDIDGVYAIASGSDGESSELYLTAYLSGLDDCFNPNWTFTGIELTIIRQADAAGASANIRDYSLVLEVFNTGVGYIQGSNLAATSTSWPTSWGGATYGGAGNLWGFSSAQIAAGGGFFRFKLRVKHATNGADAMVDGFEFVLYYIDQDGNPGSVSPDHTHYKPPGKGYSGYYSGHYPEGSGGGEPGGYISRNRLGDHTGFKTTFLTEQLSFDIDGAALASLLTDKYLDERYTVEGEGNLSLGNKITLTFTYADGPERGVTYDLHLGPQYFTQWFFAYRLVGIGGLVHFPREIASIHKIEGLNPEITWSIGGDNFSGTISPTADGIITTYSGKSNWLVNQFTTDGEPTEESGVYIRRDWAYEYPQLGYRWVDGAGFAYTQKLRVDDSIFLRKYGPEGPDAFRDILWASDLDQGYTFIKETAESYILVGGAGYVAKIDKNSGEMVWKTDLGSARYSVADIFSPDGELWLWVAANRGVYRLLNSTGEIVGYFPHGNRVSHCMKQTVGEITYLVLVGSSWFVDIGEDNYDMTPF